jgi:acetate kinase
MRILVLNAGSSSLKYKLFDLATRAEPVVAKGTVERIGTPGGSAADHREAVAQALAGIGPVDGVGHRVVHGGERFTASVIFDEEVARELVSISALAPLHNPHHLACYRAARELLGSVPHVAVFDTAFFSTLPEYAYLYPLPPEYYQRHHVRRYGFHGTSHRWVSERAPERLGIPPEQARLISCHLGNGCSICAIDGGRAIDTSFGFTPLEGLMMGTRTGDIDPSVVFHLVRVVGMSIDEIEVLLNKKSGLLAISGRSNDMRDIVAGAEAGDARCQLAVEMFCHRARKYIGAFWAELGGADAIVFTGGIGENRPEVRERILKDLDCLGYFQTLVIPANEELLIARDTARLISGTAAASKRP